MEKPISLSLALDFPRIRYDLEQAIALIHQIHLQFESLEDYRLKLKWCMGRVLVHTEMPRGRRSRMARKSVGVFAMTSEFARAGRSSISA